MAISARTGVIRAHVIALKYLAVRLSVTLRVSLNPYITKERPMRKTPRAVKEA
jgi:hypothetical protein